MAITRKLPSSFKHATGQYACKLKGKMLYLGRDMDAALKRLAQAHARGRRARLAGNGARGRSPG